MNKKHEKPASYPGDISPEDMQASAATGAFLREEEQRINREREGKYHSYGVDAGTMALDAAEKLTRDPDSEVDMEAYRRVGRMWDQAIAVNKAYDVIASGGKVNRFGDPVLADDFDLEKHESRGGVVRVNKSFDPTAKRGTGYQIKNGVATVRSGVGYNITSLPSKEFAPEHQERAQSLIRSLVQKNEQRKIEARRVEEVRVAKAILGRSGFKIPRLTGLVHKPDTKSDILSYI